MGASFWARGKGALPQSLLPKFQVPSGGWEGRDTMGTLQLWLPVYQVKPGEFPPLSPSLSSPPLLPFLPHMVF